jgi:hypothetical protein
MATPAVAPSAAVPATEEDQGPRFRLATGNIQFFVAIPQGLRGAWIAKLGGSYSPGQKRYAFLREHLAEVEKHLGLKPGESGLCDPKTHYILELSGTVIAPEGDFEKLETIMKAAGFTYNKTGKTFKGNLRDLKKIEAHLPK